MPRGIGASHCGAVATGLWAVSAAAATAGLAGGFWVRPAAENVVGLEPNEEGLWGGAPGEIEGTSVHAQAAKGKWDAAGGLVATSTALAWASLLLSAYAHLRLQWRGRLLKAVSFTLCYSTTILGLTATSVFNAWVRDSGAGGEGISDTSGGGASLGWSYWCFFSSWVMWLTLLPLPLSGIEVPAPTPEQAAQARAKTRLALSKSARRHKAYASKGPLKTWEDDDTDADSDSEYDIASTAVTTTPQDANKKTRRRRVKLSPSKGPLRWWRSSSSTAGAEGS